MTTPPGWYPDPGAPAQLRWWDGSRWSPHTAPLAGAPAPGGYPPWPYGPDPGRDLAGEARAGHYARLAVGVAAVLTAVDYVVVAAFFGGVLRRWRHEFALIGQNPNAQPRFTGASFTGGFLVIYPIGILALGAQILFIVWFYKAAEVGARAHIPARHAPGWAIAGFVVPIVNFWFPYQSAADLFPIGHPERRLAGQWWTWYLIQGFLTIPVMITAFFSTGVAVALAVVFSAVPVLTAISARRLIAAANAAHAELLAHT